MNARSLGGGLGAIALLATSACNDEEKRDCLNMFVPAVVVVVLDTTGAVVKDAHVTASQDGLQVEDAVCPESMKVCAERWVVGARDQRGTYVVRATSADGTRTAQQTVVVGGNSCSAVTQHVTLTLH